MRKGFLTIGYHSTFFKKACANYNYHKDERRGRNILCGCCKGFRIKNRVIVPMMPKGTNAYKIKGR